MNNLKISHIIFLITLPFVVIFCILLYYFTSFYKVQTDFTNLEKKGIIVQDKAINILIEANKYKLVTLSGGNKHNIESNITQLIESMMDIDRDILLSLKIDEVSLNNSKKNDLFLSNLKNNWFKLKSSNLTDFNNNYNIFLDQLNNIITYISGTSNLILDPDLDSYYLIYAIYNQFPKTMNYIVNIISDLSPILENKNYITFNKQDIAINKYIINSLWSTSTDSLNISFEVNKDSQDIGLKLLTTEDNIQDLAKNVYNITDNLGKILELDNINLTNISLINQGEEALESGEIFYNNMTEIANEMLDRRINGLKYQYVKIVSICFILMAMSFIFYLVMMKRLSKMISKLLSSLESFSRGILDLELTEYGKNEISQMNQSVNKCADKIKEIISQIKESSESVSVAANEISMGSNDLANRTEQQVSIIEEISSSTIKTTEKIKESANDTKVADNLASSARDKTVECEVLVNEVIKSMDEIDSSSHQIYKIINLIDDISFQTNLLAVNASIEAARAGKAGQGFSVVAAEVRNLANKSSSASKEIKTLIDNSGAKIKKGSELVNITSSTLKEILDLIKEVANIISRVSNANIMQIGHIDKTNQSFDHIQESTQQNAALVEECNAATISLKNQAEALVNIISFFK